MESKKLVSNPMDLVLFLRILFFLLALPFFRRAMGIEQLFKFLYTKAKKPLVPGEREYRAGKIIAFTNFLLRRNFLMLRHSCLRQSLTYLKFFSEIGLEPKIHFGVKDKSESFRGSGHAWVSVKEKILPLESAGEKFLRIYSFP